MSGARFRWLPPHLRPRVALDPQVERIFLLVGISALFAGYDLNVFGLALPQIQASLHIPENQAALTIAIFRIAAIFAMALAASADLIGRRRLLLITITGQAIATLATAFAGNAAQFVWAQFAARLFGYAEEMLCYVVVAEIVAAEARGWASGTLSAMDYLGAGVAALVFWGINLLPFGWRAIYVVGAAPLFLVAWLRRNLPETTRFAAERGMVRDRMRASLSLLRRLASEHPLRLAILLVAVAAFGFALGPASVLSSKYLQDVYHYTPGQVTLLFIPGGMVGVALNIRAGRLSDRIGRRRMAAAVIAVAGVAFCFLYGGAAPWAVPLLWIAGFFGFFAGEALLAGFAVEIVPTAYRATVSGLRYLTELLAGAASLALEGHFYDRFGAHGPAIQWMLAAIPVAFIAIFFLPEPAGKNLEEMAA